MCGGGGGFLGNALPVISDVIAAFTGNAELIPLINAGETAGLDLSKGDSLGKSLGQGAISGGEALAGQEAFGALGIGQGNTAFNSALGITGDNPAGTGLPDVGRGISSLFSSTGLNSTTGDASSIPTSPVSGGAPGTTPLAGASPSGGGTVGGAGGGAAATAAPAGVGGAGPDLTQAADAANATAGGAAQNIGSAAAPAPNATTGFNPQTFSTGSVAPTGGGISGGDITSGGSPSSGGISGFLKSMFGGGTQSGMSDQSFNNFLNQNATAPTSSASLAGEAPGTNLSSALQSADASAQIPAAGSGAAAGSATGATPAGNSGVNLLKSLGGAVGLGSSTQPVGSAFTNFLSSNANLAVPAGLIGYEAIESGKEPKGFNQLQSEAGQDMVEGQNLESYLSSGTLPPGLSGAVQQNLASQQAAIKSRYAAMGASGSSAEQQDLANAASQSQAQSAELAMNLLQQGITETGQSSGIYENLLKDVNQSDSGLTSALAAFAQMAGGGGNAGQTLKITTGQ